jgi:hypothetical protein
MTTTYEDWAYGEYLSDLAQQEEIERAINRVPIDNTSWYLGTYGDELERRIKLSYSEAKELLEKGYYGSSLVLSVTGIEILIRDFVLKPLVYGAFLDEVWAELLLGRVVSGRSGIDREILPKLVLERGIDINSLKLSNGKEAWGTFVGKIIPERNNCVHYARAIPQNVAEKSLECGDVMFSGFLKPIAQKFEMSWPESGAWHKVVEGIGAGKKTYSYSPANPFSKK